MTGGEITVRLAESILQVMDFRKAEVSCRIEYSVAIWRKLPVTFTGSIR